MPKAVTQRIVRDSLYDNIMKKHDQRRERKKRNFREYVLREQERRRNHDNSV